MASCAPLRLDDSARIGDAERADGAACGDEHGADDDHLVEGVDGGAVGREAVSDERVRSDDPSDGDSYESRDTGDGVVDGRGDTRVGFVCVSEHRRRERRDSHGETEREHEERGEDVSGVGRVESRTE